MTKQELASYLAGLIAIMDSMDDAGGMNRSRVIATEYERAYAEFKGILQKEKESETRTVKRDVFDQDRAGVEVGKSSLR